MSNNMDCRIPEQYTELIASVWVIALQLSQESIFPSLEKLIYTKTTELNMVITG